jgi:predicted transcriptional regulator
MEKEIVSTNVRYPKEIAEAMKQLAKKHHRSFNGEVVQALQEYIQRQEKAEKPDDRTQSA